MKPPDTALDREGATFGHRPGPERADPDSVEPRVSLPHPLWRPWPDNELPVSLALDAVLVDTADLAIYLSGFRVFSSALEFQLTVLTRRFRGPSGLSALFGRGGGEQLLFGVEDAAGRTAYTVGGWMPTAHAGDEPRLLLWPAGGGSRRRTDLSYLLTPLPPPGPLRLVTAWPAQDVPETVVEVQLGAVAAAAARVRRLWEVQPEEPNVSPSPPPFEPGGWFARHAADNGARRNDG